MLRWAAIEAAQHAWRPNNPWNQLYLDVTQRCGGKGNPAKAAVARKVLIATWHVLALQQPFNPSRPAARALLSRPAPVAFWPTHGPQGIEKPGQLRPTRCAQASAERELSDYRIPDPERKAPDTDSSLTSNFVFKESATSPIICPSASDRR
jgi:hypothetical protein